MPTMHGPDPSAPLIRQACTYRARCSDARDVLLRAFTRDTAHILLAKAYREGQMSAVIAMTASCPDTFVNEQVRQRKCHATVLCVGTLRQQLCMFQCQSLPSIDGRVSAADEEIVTDIDRLELRSIDATGRSHTRLCSRHRTLH